MIAKRTIGVILLVIAAIFFLLEAFVPARVDWTALGYAASAGAAAVLVS